MLPLDPTESNFKSASLYGLQTSELRKTEKGYEKGWFRGARFSATKPADNPVNAPRREFTLSAFRVSCLSRRGLRRSAGPRGALRFEKDKPGSESNRGGCFRTLEFENETLGLSTRRWAVG